MVDIGNETISCPGCGCTLRVQLTIWRKKIYDILITFVKQN